MVQKPPGSLGSRKPRGRGWGAGTAEGLCPGAGSQDGGGTAPGLPGQDRHTEGQLDAAQEGQAAWGSSSGSGEHAEGEAAGSHARPWAPGAVCVETERGPETGPFKSLRPSVRPPTPTHSIQDSWAEPAGHLGPRGAVGAQSKGGLQTLNAASQHLPLPPGRTGPAWLGVPFPRSQEEGTALSTATTANVPRTRPRPPAPNLSPLLLRVNLRSRPREQEGGRGGVWPWPPAGSSGGT